MVGRTFLMLSLLATLSLSGCLDEGAEAGTEELDTAPEADAKPEPGARMAAVEAGELTPIAEAITWDGSVGNTAYACGVVVCAGLGLGGTWDNTKKVSDVVGGELTLAWDEPIDLAIGVAKSCDGPCDMVVAAAGASPVTLSLGTLDPDRSYTVVVWHPYKNVGGVVGAQAGVETAFHVEGTLMTLPDA